MKQLSRLWAFLSRGAVDFGAIWLAVAIVIGVLVMLLALRPHH